MTDRFQLPNLSGRSKSDATSFYTADRSSSNVVLLHPSILPVMSQDIC